MKFFLYISLIAILSCASPASAQNKASTGELFPGFGICTEEEEELLDRASTEYAEISFPKKQNSKKQNRKQKEKYKKYTKKMNAPGVTEKLTEIYIRCERRMDEFFPSKEAQEQYYKSANKKHPVKHFGRRSKK